MLVCLVMAPLSDGSGEYDAGPTARRVDHLPGENRPGNFYRPMIYWMSPWSLLNAFSSSSIWPPTMRLAGLWRGGNSLNVARALWVSILTVSTTNFFKAPIQQ